MSTLHKYILSHHFLHIIMKTSKLEIENLLT